MLSAKTSKKIQVKAINVETGEFQSQTIDLQSGIRGECLIGRHHSCSIILNSPEVSRLHGRIFLLDGQCYFSDLGSSHGSQINGERVQLNQSYLLQPYDLLLISRFVITFIDLDSQEQSLNSVWDSDETLVRCLRVIEETPDVKTFCFATESPSLFSYKPGQFVALNLSIDGKKVKRCYSLSSTPSRPQTIEITVKRVLSPANTPDFPPGLVSNWLHDNIKVESQIKISKPMGNFTCCDRNSTKLLFISAGSGITPLMSMLRWLEDTKANVDIIFIYSTRTVRDLIFRSELELIAISHPNFKLAVTITGWELGGIWQDRIGKISGYTGRLNEKLLHEIAPDFQERTAYVCGAEPFMVAVKTMLEGLDFPMSNYYQESFGGSPKGRSKTVTNLSEEPPLPQEVPTKPCLQQTNHHLDIEPESDRSPVVVFAKSGKEIICEAEDLILDVAEQEGIELPSGCRMGVCGACKLPLSEGSVDYDDEPQCDRGYLLTCVAKAKGRVVIEA